MNLAIPREIGQPVSRGLRFKSHKKTRRESPPHSQGELGNLPALKMKPLETPFLPADLPSHMIEPLSRTEIKSLNRRARESVSAQRRQRMYNMGILQQPPVAEPVNIPKPGSRTRPRRSQAPTPSEPKRELDGFLLLQVAVVSDPEDVTEVTLNSASLNSTAHEDAAFFTNLTYLDLGDNSLDFGTLGYFPALQELHLHCNGIRQLSCPQYGFPNLQVLDLSYNILVTSTLETLATLPKLRELDLSANSLMNFPENIRGFHFLERLILESNEVNTASAIATLGKFPRQLSLKNNNIKKLPESLMAGLFICLEYLNIAQNRVVKEDDIAGVHQLPMLSELVVWGNPFLSQKDHPHPRLATVSGDSGMKILIAQPQRTPSSAPPIRLAAKELVHIREGSKSIRRMGSVRQRKRASTTPDTNFSTREPRGSSLNAGQKVADGTFLTTVDVENPFDDEDDNNHEMPTLESLLNDDEGEAYKGDIQTAVKSLRHALDHPLVLEDGDLVLGKRHYLKTTKASEMRTRKKAVSAAVNHAPTGQSVVRPAALDSRKLMNSQEVDRQFEGSEAKQRAKDVQNMLDDIKNRVAAVESSLGVAIQHTNDSDLQSSLLGMVSRVMDLSENAVASGSHQ